MAVLIFLLFFPAPHSEHVVVITEDGFIPTQIEVYQGDRVVFENHDTKERWPASNYHPTHLSYPGSDIRKCTSFEKFFLFDSCGPVPSDSSFTFQFHEAGEWNFHDHLYPKYSGQVVVRLRKGYATPFSVSALRAVARSADGVKKFFLHPEDTLLSYLKNVHSTASGLLVGESVSRADLVSSADYETERIYHYVFDDVAIRKVVYQLGVTRTMEKIAEESDGGRAFDCHSGAHYVGRAAYDVFREEAFGSCTTSCHSGCYHGAMEALFWETGSASAVDTVDATCEVLPTELGRQQCFHGSGHGLLALSNYDLPATIELCGNFSTERKRQDCYGGVFMENVMATLGFAAGVGEHTTEWLSSNDLHFPCSLFSANPLAQEQCYEMQTSWMLIVLSYDYQETARVCSEAPNESARTACFKSFGRGIGGTSVRSPEKTEELCALVPSQYYDSCIIGTANTLIDYWGGSAVRQSIEFCEALTTAQSKEVCFARVIERVPEVFEGEQVQHDFCNRMEAPYRDRCVEALIE